MDEAQERDAEIYRQHADALVRFATGLVGPSDAPDVVQTAVLKAITSRSWPQVRNHKAYLYQTVVNEARSQYRATMRRRAREMRTAGGGIDYLPDVRPDVLEAVGQLSMRQRAVVVLTYWEDLDEASVAEQLGIGRGSVRRHLGRARDRLRGLLND